MKIPRVFSKNIRVLVSRRADSRSAKPPNRCLWPGQPEPPASSAPHAAPPRAGAVRARLAGALNCRELPVRASFSGSTSRPCLKLSIICTQFCFCTTELNTCAPIYFSRLQLQLQLGFPLIHFRCGSRTKIRRMVEARFPNRPASEDYLHSIRARRPMPA